MLVFLSSSVVLSVATTAATTADYPDDKVTLPPATTGRTVRTQARAAPECAVREARPWSSVLVVMGVARAAA